MLLSWCWLKFSHNKRTTKGIEKAKCWPLLTLGVVMIVVDYISSLLLCICENFHNQKFFLKKFQQKREVCQILLLSLQKDWPGLLWWCLLHWLQEQNHCPGEQQKNGCFLLFWRCFLIKGEREWKRDVTKCFCTFSVNQTVPDTGVAFCSNPRQRACPSVTYSLLKEQH